MNAITLLIIIILFIGIPWFWRHQVKTYLAQKKSQAELKNNPAQLKLQQTENFLQTLFQGVNAHEVSQAERQRLHIKNEEFTCGEIEFIPFYQLLQAAKPQNYEIFYDLGSGSGKAIFAAACFFDFAAIRGVELLPGLYQLANDQLTKAHSLFDQDDASKIAKIQFLNENFLDCDFSDGDIIFINSTCMTYATLDKLIAKLEGLKVGSRIIITTKKIEHAGFRKIYDDWVLMSWGMATARIYVRQLVMPAFAGMTKLC